MSEEQQAEQRGQWSREHECPYCGVKIRGNPFHQHVRSCKRKPRGETRQLYPVALPVEHYRRFHAWCQANDLSLADGVRYLIAEKFGR